MPSNSHLLPHQHPVPLPQPYPRPPYLPHPASRSRILVPHASGFRSRCHSLHPVQAPLLLARQRILPEQPPLLVAVQHGLGVSSAPRDEAWEMGTA